MYSGFIFDLYVMATPIVYMLMVHGLVVVPMCAWWNTCEELHCIVMATNPYTYDFMPRCVSTELCVCVCVCDIS